MTRRRAPRPAAGAFQTALAHAAPKTRLAAVQAAWESTVGERVAGAARPVAEKAGTVTVACTDAVWAQELDLMQERLIGLLEERLGDQAPQNLRFRVEGEDTR
jgi:predicted nucleic acid-binding Zn ribbon protein